MARIVKSAAMLLVDAARSFALRCLQDASVLRARMAREVAQETLQGLQRVPTVAAEELRDVLVHAVAPYLMHGAQPWDRWSRPRALGLASHLI